jgi:hypothetical protein
MEVHLILLVKVSHMRIGVVIICMIPILKTTLGVANPVATILSAAMMLTYSFGLKKETKAIESAVSNVLDSKDIGGMEIRTG